MGNKQSLQSQEVSCPICDKIVKTRGLHAHLRLSHSEVDPIYHLRKKVMSQGHKGDSPIFQLSYTSEGEYRIKWASIKMKDVRWLETLFIEWNKLGNPMNFLTNDNNFESVHVDVSEKDIKEKILVRKDNSFFIDKRNNREWDSLRNYPEPTDDK